MRRNNINNLFSTDSEVFYDALDRTADTDYDYNQTNNRRRGGVSSVLYDLTDDDSDLSFQMINI